MLNNIGLGKRSPILFDYTDPEMKLKTHVLRYQME